MYEAMTHNREIPLYFSMQLYDEFVMGMAVDYGTQTPSDGGQGVGCMVEQDKERGQHARHLPPAHQHPVHLLAPLHMVHSLGLHFGINTVAATQTICDVVERSRHPTSTSSPILI